jgi:small subunit ribosomal protein S14
MAKKSMVAREKKRIRLINKHAETRQELIRKIKKTRDLAALEELQGKLKKLPVNSSKCRHVKRCQQCGRPKAVYRKFGLCRICLRNHLNLGHIPGAKKSSW